MQSNLADTEQEPLENPLIWPILETLQNISPNWKVHTLAAYLRENGYLPELDPSPEKDLFKRNFLIMNALYQLQEDLHPENYIQVEAMDIRLFDSAQAKIQPIAFDDPLRSYYTDWGNYEADEGEVKRLLNDFWRRYKKHIGGGRGSCSRIQALRLFGLSEGASQQEIRKRWRRLAFKWHPDRQSGNPEKFRQYCEAWSVLRA
jgi:DnaJ-domain-containing protein 1